MASGYKKIQKMIKNNSFGEVSYRELKNYLETRGFILEDGTNHVVLRDHNKVKVTTISRKTKYPPQLLSRILKDSGQISGRSARLALVSGKA